MKRRDFIKTAGLCLGLPQVVGCGNSIASANKSTKPNIIYIMADDLGYSELGCYGQKKIKTPNIDLLAAQGTRFTDFYSGSAVCAPARCTLMTGKHGGHAYIRDNFEVKDNGQLPLPAGTTTIASLLKTKGYKTGVFGKWGLGGVNTTGDPLNLGFDRFFGYNCQREAHNLYPTFLIDDNKKVNLQGNTGGAAGEQYAPALIAENMLGWVRQNKDKPFFLYFATVLPHLALQVPQEYLDRYKGQWPETPFTGKSYQPHPTPKAAYAAMISFLDDQVGRLMALLKELHLENDTIVFFTSDNGTTFVKDQVDAAFFESVGHLRGLKGTLYEGGIRVPMIVRWPGKIERSKTSEHVAANYDVMATLCELTDTKAPADTDGISFLPSLLKTSRQKQHDYLFWDFAGYGGQIAVRMGRWKGIKQDLKKNPAAKLELYDLESDPGEKTNVAAEHPAVCRDIENIMLNARTKPQFERFQFGNYQQDKL